MRKIKTAVLVMLIVAFTACQREDPNAPMTPEMAKSMVKMRGYSTDEAGLFKAIKADDVAVLKAFEDAGISLDGFSEKGETPLTFALQNSENKMINALIEKVDINQKDKNGNAALHLALNKNREDVFEKLLARNADVNVGGLDGKTQNQTPLYLAVIKRREDLIAKLLERGADPNIADSGGFAPLSEACIGATANAAIVKALLDKGANPNFQEPLGATALIYISGNKDARPEDRREIINLLLAKGADKKIRDKKGRTAYDAAKQFGVTDVLELVK